MNRKYLVIGLAALAVMAFGFYSYVERTRQSPEGLIQANGRIEGDTIIIASKHPGKIVAVNVHEGDDVESGQVLVQLDDVATQAMVVEAEAATAAALAQLQQCEAEYELLCQEVPFGIEAEIGNSASRGQRRNSKSYSPSSATFNNQ